jgi:hypothetical protein
MAGKKGSKKTPVVQPKPTPKPAESWYQPVLNGPTYPNDGVLIIHRDHETVVESTIKGVKTRSVYPQEKIAVETRHRHFPRLYVGTNSPIPQFETEAVGAEFDQIDEPMLLNSDPKFHCWRRVTWRVVPHQHFGRATTAFRVVAEVPLTAEDIAYWTGVPV